MQLSHLEQQEVLHLDKEVELVLDLARLEVAEVLLDKVLVLVQDQDK